MNKVIATIKERKTGKQTYTILIDKTLWYKQFLFNY